MPGGLFRLEPQARVGAPKSVEGILDRIAIDRKFGTALAEQPVRMTDVEIPSFTASLLACVLCALVSPAGYSLDRDRSITQFY
jgi:hypothetical protein